jgi:hypothetical protein
MVRRLDGKLNNVRYRAGSALVMVVVLTVLLAVVGVMFVMTSRVDEIATSAISDSRELSAAVDVVVNRIQTILVDDLFGSDANMLNGPGDSTSLSVGDEDEYWDYPGLDNPWLASLEPVWVNNNGTPADPCDDIYRWPQISDIVPEISIMRGIPPSWSIEAVIAEPVDANDFWLAPVPADADGDGVTDSLWVRLPNITSSKGKPVFAAVRIIDNCAMLNLNTAHTADPCSEGKYLSSVDYERFLRGDDRSNPERIRMARDPCGSANTQESYHDVIMQIENPGSDYSLFDIGDELEIRNRYLLTSLVQARFEREDIAYETFDWGRGFLVGGWKPELKVKRIPFDSGDFYKWKWRMDHRNFEGDPINPTPEHPEPYKYDRRHVCTFYSFDRPIRSRPYPLETNSVFSPGFGVPVNVRNIGMSYDTDPLIMLQQRREIRRNILHLLYVLRAYFLDIDADATYQEAARRSAQVVANMIDYIDDDNPGSGIEGPFFDPEFGSQTNDNPTYINREIIRELILEVSTYYHDILGIGNVIDIDIQTEYDFGLGIDDPDETVYGYERQPFISELYRSYDSVAGTEFFAIELCNPYLVDLDIENWRIKIGEGPGAFIYDIELPEPVTIPAASILPTQELGRQVLVSDSSILGPSPVPPIEAIGLTIGPGEIVQLQRPDPANTGEFITVDATESAQTDFLFSPGDDEFVSKRDDTAWKFTNAGSYTNDNDSTLGSENLVTRTGSGYQMPVPNDNEPLATLHDFEMVLFVGNDPNTNTITMKVDLAEGEGDVRFDVESRPELLDYICFMNRPKGNLPGRININTATMEVIRAAIPPHPAWNPDADSLAQNIVAYRNDPRNGPFERIANLLDVTDFDQMTSDPNTGDATIGGDFEERDWILSRVANIFTVRSDVFTAYILVRIGHDGPQKRMIAIFDRSNVFSPADKPRLVALHPVPDPR